MLLGLKHDRGYLAKTRNDNVNLHLNIDDNYQDLKMMCYIVKGKLMENVRDARTTTIEISRAIIKDKGTLKTCKNMLPYVRARWNTMKNEIKKEDKNDNEEEGGAINECNDVVILEKYDKKERSHKLHIELSTRLKTIIVSEVKS